MKIEHASNVVGARELWTPALVRNALVDAILILRALPDRHKPAGVKAQWPEFALDYPRAEQARARRRPSSIEIYRMEHMLVGVGRGKSWLNGRVMLYPDHRALLMQWARWVANGCAGPDGVVETEQEFAWRIRQSLTSLQRKRDFAAGVVAAQANQEGVLVWHSNKPKRSRRRNLHARST